MPLGDPEGHFRVQSDKRDGREIKREPAREAVFSGEQARRFQFRPKPACLRPGTSRPANHSISRGQTQSFPSKGVR
jgi:hypothetical protein